MVCRGCYFYYIYSHAPLVYTEGCPGWHRNWAVLYCCFGALINGVCARRRERRMEELSVAMTGLIIAVAGIRLSSYPNTSSRCRSATCDRLEETQGHPIFRLPGYDNSSPSVGAEIMP